MTARLKALTLAAAVVAAAWGLPRAAAGESNVTLLDVRAVEPADSTYGRYRVVFIVSAPLPPPTSNYGGVSAFLGGQVLRYPGFPQNETVIFGYFNLLPEQASTLFLYELGRARSDTDGTNPSLPIDARAMLAKARPAAGEYEAPHVRRTNEGVDLVAALQRADAVLTARLVRREAHVSESGIFTLFFEPLQSLKESPRLADGELISFDFANRRLDLELGAVYLLFASLEPTNRTLANRPPELVRVWWPEDDFVLQFVQQWLALPDAAAADELARRRAAQLLSEGLTSPTAEVRYTAAQQLASHPELRDLLPADVLESLRRRAVSDPSPYARQALSGLLRAEKSE